MISVIIILLIVLLCFYIGILYTNPMIINIGYALGILLVISIIEVLYHYFSITCQIDVPIPMSEQSRPVNVIIKIRNKSFLPVGKIEVCVEHKHVLYTKAKVHWLVIYDMLKGESRHAEKMALKGAGCHVIQMTQIRIHSLFGLISIKRKCTDVCSVLMMPEIYAVGVQVGQAVRNFIGEAEVYDEFRPGHDSGETFEIREYREKDKLQSIHWKLSAKTEELMVRESSLPKACAIVLMLDMKPRDIRRKRTYNKETELSAYFDLVASISFSLLDQNCPHFVAWYSTQKEKIRRIRVDDEASFYLFLDCYLREVTPNAKKVRDEYRETYRNEWYLHDITVNEALELYKDAEFVTKLDEKKIKDECEKLELLL